MKQKCIKFIGIFILCLTTFMPNKVLAESTVIKDNGYSIKSYDINMVVNEDNTFDITEKITANFNVERHGIYRRIPLKNSITRLDGTKSNNRAKISNVTVSERYTISKENGYEVIKIGDPNKVITGSRSYTIKYTYDIGKDPLKDVDELYFNLIGNEWDTSISNVTFRIKMPKSFDKSLLGFSTGIKGSTNNSNISYSVNGNVISGSYTSTLNVGQALTVRLTLPEGYFVGVSSNFNIYAVISIIISLIFVLIAYILWAKYGKDDKVIETVEFYPPEGYNSAEIGFLYEGSANTQSVISLLIYLANAGYLKIEEIEEQGIFKSSKSFRITKIKEYDGNNENERIFFNGLFKNRNIVDMGKVKEIMEEAKRNGEKIKFTQAMELATDTSEKTSVTSSDLYDNFYTTLNKIKSNLNSKENKNKIFESSASKKGKWLIIMIIVIWALITIKPVIEYSESESLIFALLFPGIGFSILFSLLFGKNPIIVKIFGLIWGLLFGGMPWSFLVLPALKEDPMYLISYIIGIICVAALVIFIKIMPKRTIYGNEILGKIGGFKRFLETAEKPQLESLVEQNPEYFYNILPYTYALGVSDKWMKQFETIALQAPNWYDSRDDFNMHTFGAFMTTTMASATSAMSSSPSSSSSGGSSGGGSSGGGSGGGGGGSW